MTQTHDPIAHWDSHWKKSGVCMRWPEIPEAVLEGLHTSLQGDFNGPFLEVGSGTGVVSLHLAGYESIPCLLDTSLTALTASRTLFQENNKLALFVCADARSLPFKRGFFRYSWSAGLLEHFSYPEQKEIISEMARVSQEGAKIIILVPYAGSLGYRLGKLWAHFRRQWGAGHETPVWSLRNVMTLTGLCQIQEFTCGYSAGLKFLSWIPFCRSATSFFSCRKNKLFMKLLKPYLLVSVGVIV